MDKRMLGARATGDGSMASSLKLLQQALLCDPPSRAGCAGRALRPHYRQLLPPMALFALRSQPSLGDAFEYADYRQLNVADLTHQTLSLMESRGGPGSGAIIKQVIPTYEAAEQDLHRGFRS